jgi:hypothetical protein
MTPDEITSALKLAETPPSTALKAGLNRADELAPLVYAIADKFCRGVYLLPEENALLFYGLSRSVRRTRVLYRAFRRGGDYSAAGVSPEGSAFPASRGHGFPDVMSGWRGSDSTVPMLSRK